MDLIAAVLASTNDFEAPRKFYYWSAITAISAVLKDRVWFNMGDNYNVYPNLYVLLYGPSGIRKGPAIALAEDLVSRVDNTRVIDGRSSIEAVIKELGTAQTRPGKPLIKDACGFMVASELSSSIIGNSAAMDIMTNLYDRLYNEKEWKYRLKVGESARLLKPTITWLAGTNEALFNDFIPEKNIHGGLIGRMFVITETKKHRSNSLMFKTVAPDKPALANILLKISKIEGEFTSSDEVRHDVEAWYNDFDSKSSELGDDTGFVSRVHDFIIKTAMLIAAGRRQDKEILLSDIEEARSVIVPLINPLKKVVNSTKKDDASDITKRGIVLCYLSNRSEFKAERTKILQSIGLQVSAEDLDRVAQDMIQRGVLVIDNHGGTVTYRLKTERPEVAEWVKQFRS